MGTLVGRSHSSVRVGSDGTSTRLPGASGASGNNTNINNTVITFGAHVQIEGSVSITMLATLTLKLVKVWRQEYLGGVLYIVLQEQR